MKKHIWYFFVLFALFAIFLTSSCKKDDNPSGSDNTNNPPAQNYALLLGRVQNESGTLLGSVTVTIQGKTVLTNEQGWFSVSELTAGTKKQVSFSKSGYISTYKVVDVNNGQSSFIDATLATAPPSQTVPNTGGTITPTGGGQITFQSGSFVDASNNQYTGPVTVAAKYFDPTTTTYNQVFPGNFSGITTSGTEAAIQSFGFIDANLKSSSGATLKLASGKTSTLTIPIPTSLQASAPATISMWWYDTTAAVWREEGVATKSGNNYTGTVTHFTSWNWDRVYDVCYITGRVIDGNGNPIQNAFVTADGVDYTGRSYRYTGSDGTFSIGVRANSTVIVKATKDGTTSSPLTVTTPTTNGGTKAIGDIVLSPPIASITLTWGLTPYDVDSHLYIPAYNSQGPGHVYWSSMGSATSYPFASLDTDDRYSYGPEVVTIYRKFPGVYKYIVHNYSGESSAPLAGSNAKVTLIIGAQLYAFSVPTSNPNGYNTWRVFELNVDANGAVTITTINDFQPSTTSLPKMTLQKK